MLNPVQKSLFLLAGLLLALILWAGAMTRATAGIDDEVNLPPVDLTVFSDLQAVAEEARRRQVPILIMFSMKQCGYCVVVKEEFLKPMLRSGDYDDRVIIGIVRHDGVSSVRDFNGDKVEVAELAHRYGAPVTPTVIFVGPDGKELAPKVIGMSTVHFYGGDLDYGINQSLKRLRNTDMAMRPSL